MGDELSYTQDIPQVMNTIRTETAAISTAVDDLERLIGGFVAASSGTAFQTLQGAIADWRGQSTASNDRRIAFAKVSDDGYADIVALDHQAAGWF